MTKKKKIIIIISTILAVLIIAMIALIILFKSGNSKTSDEQAYVSAVSEIINQGSMGMFNRYTGVVEPQETLKIEKDSEKTIKEILVNEGDSVSVGTPLFSYDTDEINLNLSQAELDLEGYTNEINALYTQIASLEKEKRSAASSDQLYYTTQIQEKQNEIRRAEYNKKSKEVEINQIKKSLDTATVTSEIDGVVQSINTNGEYDNMTGEQLPFMTVLATGNYRVKGKINETNAWSIGEGSPVIIRSRIDENQTWTGIITKIDFENQITDNNNYYYMGDSGEQSTNYPFYIELDTSSGLMLGQHVFIEMDNGQMTEKEGLWLTESYLLIEGNDVYVWAKNNRDKLEKRKIEIGDYDADLMEYQVVSGLETTDCIAWPTSNLKEGMPCITSSVSEMIQMNTEAEMMQSYDNDAMNGDEFMDGEIIDGDGMIIDDDGMDGEIIDGDGMDGEIIDGSGMDSEIIDDGNMDGEIIGGSGMDGEIIDNDGIEAADPEI